MSDNNNHIKDYIQAFIKQNNLTVKLQEEELRQAWKEIFGPSINQHTTELFLKKKVLIVKLNSSVLRNELSMAQERMKERINQYFNRVVVEEIILS